MSSPTALQKAWSTLQARAALRGLCLFRSALTDGPVRVFVQRGSALREVVTVDDLEALASQVAQPGS